MRHYPWHPHPKLSATESVYGKENSPRQPAADTPLKEGGSRTALYAGPYTPHPSLRDTFPHWGRLYSTHNLAFSAARHHATGVVYLRNTHLWRLPVADREVFCGAFSSKKWVFCQAFLHKKADLLIQTKTTFKVHGRTFFTQKK